MAIRSAVPPHIKLTAGYYGALSRCHNVAFLPGDFPKTPSRIQASVQMSKMFLVSLVCVGRLEDAGHVAAACNVTSDKH